MSSPSVDDTGVDALVMGESLVDEIRTPDAEVRRHPGGSPANVAIGLARLGRTVALRTSYGNDDAGALIDRALRRAGVRPVVDDPFGSPTSIARAVIQPDGSARYAFDLRWNPDPTRAMPRSRVLHVGSLGAILQPGRDLVLRSCVEHDGPVSLDLNVRPAVADREPGSRDALQQLVRRGDIVKASDEDIAWLHPGADPLDIAARWVQQGASLACVTRGARGIFAMSARGRMHRPSRAPRIVDTVGAGDTVMAVLIDAVLSIPAADLAVGLEEDALGRLLDRATTAASITLSRRGADLPTSRELALALV